mgnify:CR=1 FL=1
MLNLPIGATIEKDHLWCQVINRLQSSYKGALFLDRDGVIVEDTDYLQHPEDVRLINGSETIISKANKLTIPIIIVTNQAGIARGKFTWKEFIEVQEKLMQILEKHKVFINAVFACPHHSDGTPPYNIPNHRCRKPNPGMLIEAAQRLPINLSKSWLIGDKASDLQAAYTAGLKGGTHVLTGHGNDKGEREESMKLNSKNFTCMTADSIANTEEILEMLDNDL